MSKKALALVAVAGLALAGYAAAATTGALPDSVDMGLGANAKCQRIAERSGDEGSVEKRVAMCARHGKRMGLPPFEEEDGKVQGRWVAFAIDGSALADYTSRGPFADAVVFERVELGKALNPEGIRGGHWSGKAGDVRVLALDAPNGFLLIGNRGNDTATVTYTLAPDVSAETLPNGTGLLLERDGHEAVLRVHGGATVSADGSTVTASLPKDSAVVFHVRGFPRLLAHEWKAIDRHHDGQRDRAAPPPEDGTLPAEV